MNVASSVQKTGLGKFLSHLSHSATQKILFHGTRITRYLYAGELSAGELSVGELSAGESSVGELSVGESSGLTKKVKKNVFAFFVLHSLPWRHCN